MNITHFSIDEFVASDTAARLKIWNDLPDDLEPHAWATLAMLEGSALPPEVKMTRLLMHQLRWHGATLRNRTPAEKAALMEMVATRVWPALAEGRIHPVIDRVFALAEAEKALTRMQERLHLGKILLKGGD